MSSVITKVYLFKSNYLNVTGIECIKHKAELYHWPALSRKQLESLCNFPLNK